MDVRNGVIAAQCVLSLTFLCLAPGLVASSTETTLGNSRMLVAQEPQQPQPNPDAQQPTPAPPGQQVPKSTSFAGTIVKDGSSFVLRDSSGTVYQLDAQDKAQPFEGKPVKVTGLLEETAKLIHVEAIESISA
jgi:hypothetical protein